jgi:hypothetical protein
LIAINRLPIGNLAFVLVDGTTGAEPGHKSGGKDYFPEYSLGHYGLLIQSFREIFARKVPNRPGHEKRLPPVYPESSLLLISIP